MKKIKKKEWILPLVLLIILLFSACNNGEKTKTENVELVNNKNTIIDGVKYNDAELTPEEAFDKFIDLHSKAKITEVKLLMNTKLD